MDIGSAIKHCREKRNISQKYLAEITDVSVSHLCLIEKSKREASLSTLESLSEGLEVPVSVLVLLAATKNELNSKNGSVDLDELINVVDSLI